MKIRIRDIAPPSSLLCALLIFSLGDLGIQAQTADATSLNNKVMAGYQGWFRTPGDIPDYSGWSHWFRSDSPTAGGLAFDAWPDTSELTREEKYPVPGFKDANGNQAFLYSAQNYHTVLRHFQWMQAAGIDGVWLSQFCSHMPGGRSEADYPNVVKVMDNVRAAATATGRTWAFMYDFSGLGTNNVASVMSNQWKRMVDSGITSDPRYLHHDGKPVLLLWGFFPNRRQSNPAYCNPLISFLQAPGIYEAAVVGGGEPYMRRLGNADFQAMLMRLTAWMPWQVGRFLTDPVTGYRYSNTTHWAGDAAMCASNHVLYIPVLYSGTHIAGRPPAPPDLPTVPRRNGNMLWEQFAAASQIHTINSVFIAMFDEVNEGTEIMKICNTPPTNANFITYEGAGADWYMRLVSLGESVLRKQTLITMPIPISPFDPKLSYEILNKFSGLALNNPGSKTDGAPINQSSNPVSMAGLQWQFLYDGAGCYTIKSKADGKALSRQGSPAGGHFVSLSDDDASDDSKWEMIWDGTGCCRIKGEGSGQELSCDGATAHNAPIVQAADTNSDALRWRIQNR